MSVAESRPDFEITALGGVLGAEISGLDLAAPLDEATLRAIRRAFLEHHVLVFREQDLSPEDQARFTRYFGELEAHVIRLADGKPPPLVHVVSNLDRDGRPTATPYSHGNYFWHTDKSYHAIPSLATLLHAREVPAEGGDTLFADTAGGYDKLAAARRAEIADLHVEHSWEASRLNTGNRPATEEEKRERPPVVHPLVRTHPESGRKCLYMGTHTSHIVELEREAGRALLAELLEASTTDDLVYTHRWKPGDLVMWDNRCLLHRADANYDMGAHRRVLHRTVVKGTEAPV